MDSLFLFSVLLISTVAASASSITPSSSQKVAPSSSPKIAPSSPTDPPSTSHTNPTKSPTTPPSTSSAAPTPASKSIAPSSATHSSPAVSSSVAPTTPKVNTTTTTTTEKPTTTTTEKPTTTPKPLPHFEVKNNGSTCIYLQGNMSLVLKTSKNTTNYALVQSGAAVSGHCHGSANTSDITVQWGKVIEFMLKFTYTKDMWYLSQVMVKLNSSEANVTANAFYKASSNDKLYQAAVNKSYACMRDQKLSLESSDPKAGNITVDFVSVQIQPFPSAEKPFKNSMMCPATTDDSTTSSIVPIAVGCALAGLIVIVLIAYLIGRRKNNRGYQQV